MGQVTGITVLDGDAPLAIALLLLIPLYYVMEWLSFFIGSVLTVAAVTFILLQLASVLTSFSVFSTVKPLWMQKTGDIGMALGTGILFSPLLLPVRSAVPDLFGPFSHASMISGGPSPLSYLVVYVIIVLLLAGTSVLFYVVLAYSSRYRSYINNPPDPQTRARIAFASSSLLLFSTAMLIAII